MKSVLTYLSETALEVSRLDKEAKRLLYELGDQQGYTKQLRQKAKLLSELADAVAGLDPLPPPLDNLVQEKIGGFSFEAERALRLDSVFYMSVLLMDECQEGEANDLETFVHFLQKQASLDLSHGQGVTRPPVDNGVHQE